MRQAARSLWVLTVVCGAALGDQITIKTVLYSNVRVTDAGDCKITYEVGGRSREKPCGDVNYVYIASQPGLTKAENLLRENKFAEAVAAYDKLAAGEAGRGWLARLVRYRRLRAADAGRMTGRAVEDWLAVAKECGGSADAAALVPKGLGKRKSAGNAKAIRLLAAARKQKASPAFQTAVKGLLLSLYELEGKTDEASALRGGGGSPAATTMTSTEMTVSAGKLGGQLQEAANQIKAGQCAAAADGIKARIRRYSARELPTALLLRGKALLRMYEKGAGKDRKALLAAGLCFMRVASCVSPSEPEVPEATFLAAKVCEHLGNKVAAANTYRMISQRHPDTKWAQQAQAALQDGG